MRGRMQLLRWPQQVKFVDFSKNLSSWQSCFGVLSKNRNIKETDKRVS